MKSAVTRIIPKSSVAALPLWYLQKERLGKSDVRTT